MSFASDVYGPSMSPRRARSVMQRGRRPGPATRYGFRVSPVTTLRQDAAMPELPGAAAVVTPAPKVIVHWSDDRTLADLVGDQTSDLGALMRKASR